MIGISTELLTIVSAIAWDRTILRTVGAATRQAREFCTVCGWPLRGSRCDACGEHQAPMALEDSMRRFAPQRYVGLDDTGLEKATDAFRRGDFARAVTACLGMETGLSVRTIAHPEGPAWTVAGQDSTVFVFVELVPMQLVIESPMARLPRTQRIAAMRFALELCDDDRLASRICLRDDLLVMRFVAQLGAAPPALIRHVLHEMSTMSERYTEIFMAAFNARVPTRAEVRSSPESIGKKRQLGTLRPSTAWAPVVQPPPATLRPEFSPSRDDDLPPVLAPTFGGDSFRRGASDELPPILSPPSMMRDPWRPSSASSDQIPAILAPPSMSRESKRSVSSDDIPAILAPPREPGKPISFDDIPAILAPSAMQEPVATEAWDSMPAVLMPPEPSAAASRAPLSIAAASVSAPSEREMSPTTARLGAIPAVMMSSPATGTRQRTALGLSDAGRLANPDLDPDAAGRRLAPDKPATPADKLCELLQRAQVLATALSFAERQATTLLLVRAVVYRAVYDFGEPVPDAVAYLVRTTASATRMIWSSTAPPDKNAPMPMAEPSLLAMERVVAQRAQMPKEPKLAMQPFTTAGQAREHLAKYVEEIEQGPNDQPLRHFLALGALCELLVRARLPSQTSQKLKDIVAHAQREANKPASSLDLMMAALKRIVNG